MRREAQQAVYHIGIVARMVDCHPQTLRLYERLGLVHPGRTGANVRLYSDADVERVRGIKRLTGELGVNLAGVEIVLQLVDRVERLQQQVELMREALEQGPRALGPATDRSAKTVDVIFREQTGRK